MKQETSKVLRETERDPFEDDEDEEPTPPPAAEPSKPKPAQKPATKYDSTAGLSSIYESSSKKSKKDKKGAKGKAKAFNLEAEKAKMKVVISESGMASVNLLNALQLINREHERVSNNADASKKFEQCKLLRRHVLRYVSYMPQKSL